MATTRTTDEQMDDTFKQIDDALNKIEAAPPLNHTPTRAFAPQKKIDDALADALADAIAIEEAETSGPPCETATRRLAASRATVLRLRRR